MISNYQIADFCPFMDNFNPLHPYVECESTSVLISEAPLSRLTYFCKTCEREAALQPGSCFKVYDTLKSYKIQQ